MIFLRIVGSAVIILDDSVQCTVEQSFFTKRFKLVEQRWRAYTWGGVRVELRMFCKYSWVFCMADTLTGGGIFLRRGNKQETVGSTAARGLSLENEPMYGNGSKLVRFKPPLEQQRQFGEICTARWDTKSGYPTRLYIKEARQCNDTWPPLDQIKLIQGTICNSGGFVRFIKSFAVTRHDGI